MSAEFKSPRKAEEELRKQNRDRFEEYMERVDRGEMTIELAMTALKGEVGLERTE